MSEERFDRWVVRYGPQSDVQPSLRLICFPYAGGGPAIFHKWRSFLPPEIEIWGILLPGRGSRIREQAFTRLTPIVQTVAGVLQPFLDRPYALFGHSLGAITCYELTQHLRGSDSLQPVHLLLSGHRAPHRPRRSAPIHNADEETFLERVRQFDGTPGEFFQHQELVQLMLPSLRADFAVWETYTYEQQEPLDCPLSIFGSYGDPEAEVADFEAWQMHTNDQFSLHLFDGGHFYFQSDLPAFLQIIAEELQPYLD